MNRNFDRALQLVLKHEGGFVNHPADPGGATNRGVTLATFRRYVKPKGTVADLKAITPAQLRIVYKRHYWDACNCDDMPDGSDYAVFDFAVNSGPSRAARYAQKVVGVTQDGVVGPQTLAAIDRTDNIQFIDDLCDARMAFLRRLSTWGTFGRGWSRRVFDVRRDAKAMAGAGLTIANPASANIKPENPALPRSKPPQNPTQPAQPETRPGLFAALWAILTAIFRRQK